MDTLRETYAVTPPRRATDVHLERTLKLADRYGLASVFAVILLGFVLGLGTWFAKDMHSMLAQHIQASSNGNRTSYQACISLAVLSGTAKEACIAPEPMR